jgi:hypothetical protein
MPAAVPSGVKARKGQVVAVVMIGVDPHKGSHTAVALGADEAVLDQVRVRASAAQAERLLTWAAAWPERTWAVEGAGGLGHLLAQELVAAGELVLDVQPKLAARVRLLAAGAVNKNDPNDARSVAVVALRSPSCLPVRPDDHAAVLKIWAKRHRDLSRARNQVACRLHAALCELVPAASARKYTQIRPPGSWPRPSRAAPWPKPAPSWPPSSWPAFAASMPCCGRRRRSSRNHWVPTGCDTPAATAASSLDSPHRIAAQNRCRCSRLATGGRPGDRIGALPATATAHPLARPIRTPPNRGAATTG